MQLINNIVIVSEMKNYTFETPFSKILSICIIEKPSFPPATTFDAPQRKLLIQNEKNSVAR